DLGAFEGVVLAAVEEVGAGEVELFGEEGVAGDAGPGGGGLGDGDGGVGEGEAEVVFDVGAGGVVRLGLGGGAEGGEGAAEVGGGGLGGGEAGEGVGVGVE